MGLSGSVRDLEAAGQHVAREFGTKAHGCKTNHGYVREFSWASLQHQPECKQNGSLPFSTHTLSHFPAEFHTHLLCLLFFQIFFSVPLTYNCAIFLYTYLYLHPDVESVSIVNKLDMPVCAFIFKVYFQV